MVHTRDACVRRLGCRVLGELDDVASRLARTRTCQTSSAGGAVQILCSHHVFDEMRGATDIEKAGSTVSRETWTAILLGRPRIAAVAAGKDCGYPLESYQYLGERIFAVRRNSPTSSWG